MQTLKNQDLFGKESRKTNLYIQNNTLLAGQHHVHTLLDIVPVADKQRYLRHIDMSHKGHWQISTFLQSHTQYHLPYILVHHKKSQDATFDYPVHPLLTLFPRCPDFYVSAVQVFWKHCGKRRNCTWEIACYMQFLLFLQCFLSFCRTF